MDSETNEGVPITFQFFSEHVKKINDCIFLYNKRVSPTTAFFRHLRKLPPGNYRMYGHNLEFDMVSVMWDVKDQIRDGEIKLDIEGFHIEGRYSKPIFAVISDKHRYIELVDSFLWFMTSLDNAGKMVCPDLPKLVRPSGLGQTNYKSNNKVFVDYAFRDAVVAFHLGCAIERYHEELHIPSQISLASMAAAVFRRHYMCDDIYQPPSYEWMVGAAASYHGGVNRIQPDTYPAWHSPVTALDLSSAYPYAMTFLPNFSDDSKYKKFRAKAHGLKRVPAIGVYKISGQTDFCKWPALFSHDFQPIVGRFSNVWVTGFELNEALHSGEVKLKTITGYYYDDDNTDSPFSRYSKDFYARKSTGSDPVSIYMWKILLNGLTGKFIQTSPDYTLINGQLVKIRRAGGLYFPFGASLITGHTRSVMHSHEHHYNALHTATDGIFVPGIHKLTTKKELGALVYEGHGDLALFRNKLYIVYSDSSEKGSPSAVFDNKFVLKSAKHGFQGSLTNLEQMLVSRQRKYKTHKPVKLKTALKSGQTPNKFVTTERNLHVSPDFGSYKYSKGGKVMNG